MGLEGTTGGQTVMPSTDKYTMSVPQAARLHFGIVRVEGIISGISKLKKIIKSQEYECTICGNIMRFTPKIEFENQKGNLTNSRPDLYQPMTKIPDKCSNRDCESNKTKFHTSLSPRCEYINAIVIELRDLQTFSDIDSLKAVVFDEDTLE